jgi:hypothetical protein
MSAIVGTSSEGFPSSQSRPAFIDQQIVPLSPEWLDPTNSQVSIHKQPVP